MKRTVDLSDYVIVLVKKSDGNFEGIADGSSSSCTRKGDDEVVMVDIIDKVERLPLKTMPSAVTHFDQVFWMKSNPICFYQHGVRICYNP